MPPRAETCTSTASTTTNERTNDRAVVARINRLVEDALRTPTDGIGKPEPLKHASSNAWYHYGRWPVLLVR